MVRSIRQSQDSPQVAKEKSTSATKSVLAREEDGTIQITLTIARDVVDKTEHEVLTELAKQIEVPGFRRGNAPLDQVKNSVSAQTILEKILSRVLPNAFQEAIKEHGIHPILTPRFELINAGEVDWQVRAITCEAPKIEIGDYKKEIESSKRVNSLWIPGKDDAKPKGAAPTQAEKENLVIETLLKTSSATIPESLIEEEVNHRLSSLVEQTQKLGLTVEQYLSSTGKTTEGIRAEYAKQARDQITLMLVLSKIAEAEAIEIPDSEIEEAAASGDQTKTITSSQKEVVRAILRRRRALDKLVSIL